MEWKNGWGPFQYLFYDGTKNIKIPSRWNPNEIPLADIDTSLIGLFITLGPFFSSAATAYVSITEKPNFVSGRETPNLKIRPRRCILANKELGQELYFLLVIHHATLAWRQQLPIF